MSSGKRTQWVTFDCYGTLVDWCAWFADMIAPIAGDRASDLQRAYRVIVRQIERETRQTTYKDVLTRALSRAAVSSGVSLPAPDARALQRAWGVMRPFDDVEGMLAELRRRGWRLAVLTNCDDDLFEVTHRSFRKPFDLFVTAERVRAYKPERWPFLGFERITRVSRRDWVHVASGWYHDIDPARALGIGCVWLDRHQSADRGAGGLLRVSSAVDVAAAVEALFEGCCQVA